MTPVQTWDLTRCRCGHLAEHHRTGNLEGWCAHMAKLTYDACDCKELIPVTEPA